MLGCRWILLGLLATLAVSHLTTAYPQSENKPSLFNPDIDYTDYVTEDQLTDEELEEIAEEIADEIVSSNDQDVFTRGKFGSAFKSFGKGFKKGGKKVGSAILSAGKKTIKVSGKGIKIMGKGLKKVGKTTGKGILKAGKLTGKGLLKAGKVAGKGLKTAGKKTKTIMTTKGKKIWANLKTKMNGEMAQAGKQLLKVVGEQVLEQGMSMAVEAVTPMIVEYVMDKTQDGLCSCADNGLSCSCCAQPPGFDNACLNVKIMPVRKMMQASIKYNGREIAKTLIKDEEAPASCSRLSGVASFITACLAPIGIGEIEGGFRGCLNINLDPMGLERPMCIDFTGTRKDGSARFLSMAEINGEDSSDDETDDIYDDYNYDDYNEDEGEENAEEEGNEDEGAEDENAEDKDYSEYYIDAPQ